MRFRRKKSKAKSFSQHLRFPVSLLSLFFIFLANCTSLFASASKGESFPLIGSYQEVWEAALETLKKEEIPIYLADVSKGYIQSKTFPLFNKEYKAWAKKPTFARSGLCLVEVGVIKQDDRVTTVGVHTYFRRESNFYFFGFGNKDKSRGVFEKLLIGRINDTLVKKQLPKLNSIIVGCSFRYDVEKDRYVIAEVRPGGLADEQGLRTGDTLEQIDGKIINPDNLFQLITDTDGERIRVFTVKRRKQTLQVPVSVFYADPKTPRVGISVEREGLSGRFKIINVMKNSPAEEAGLRIGDFILEQNGVLINGWRSYYRALVQAQKSNGRTFVIERNGQSQTKVVAQKIQ